MGAFVELQPGPGGKGGGGGVNGTPRLRLSAVRNFGPDRSVGRIEIGKILASYEKGDLEAARRAGVPLANTGGANSVAGRWRGNALPWVFELYGKALGIVGLETIGKKSVRLALAFCVEAIYYIERPDENIEDRLSVRFQLLRNYFA